MQTIVSVDGFIATDDDRVGPLFDWFQTGDVPLDEDGARVTRQVLPEDPDEVVRGDRVLPLRFRVRK